MVTKRLDVDAKRVNFYDGQRITRTEMRDEQNRNLSIDAANIGNFMGSGVLLENPIPKVIFDTNNLNTEQQNLLDTDTFDGQNVYIGDVENISDTIQGVQLSITLSNVELSGAEVTRISIFGITFGGNLIHDELTFNENGTQTTRGRYKEIKGILFNNFAGNFNGSRNPALEANELVGRCIIKEADKMEASIDHIMASQTRQPNLFLNSFIPGKIGDTATEMIQGAIGADQSIADLNIGLSSLTIRELEQDDVTTKIGQKFLAQGQNIQKISVLLAVKEDETVPIQDAYNWSGLITLTIHKLQTEVTCPVAPTPDNSVDFDPNPSIIAQLSLDSDALEKQGIILNNEPQIVDFVFTGTNLSNPTRSPIEKDKYYMFTISRSGNAGTGIILIEEAPRRSEYGYMTVYDGVQWINIKESDMWFSIEGDYIKIADGIAYQNGIGSQIKKIKKDITNTEVPYVKGLVEFVTTTTNTKNFLLLESGLEYSFPEKDQRTGNDVFTRINYTPVLTHITESQLNTLRVSAPSPVLISESQDKNPKGNPTTITGTTTLVGSAEGNIFHIINPDADLINNNLIGSLLKPDNTSNTLYRIIKAELINDSYGDVNGDGIIDSYDVAQISSWISNGWDFDLSTTAGQQQIVDGYASLDWVLRADVNGDGKVDATDASIISSYVNKTISSFSVGTYFTRLQLTVENLTDSLAAEADINGDNVIFDTAPFTSTAWEIEYFPTWIHDNIQITDIRRKLPTTFTDESTSTLPSGRNNWYVPNHLFIGGEQLNPDGTPYSIDLEVNNLILNIPIVDSLGSPTFLDGYKGFLLFDNFVAESSLGKTSSGFNAMKYSDGSYVQFGDFELGKVKIVPTIQSTANKYSVSGDVEDIVGLYYSPDTSLLTIYVDNLYDDGLGNSLKPRSMKISIAVYLKKSGFINQTEIIDESDIRKLLDI